MKEPNVDEYKKLTRVMKYVQGTIVLPLILPIDTSENIKRYIDAEFVVHKDMRSHTDGFINMGTGAAYVKSRKQKFNIKSPNEAEIVGVDNVPT